MADGTGTAGSGLRKLIRVYTTTASHADIEDAERGPYPSQRARVCWNMKVVSENAVWAYGQRDLLTASGCYTATKLEVVELGAVRS